LNFRLKYRIIELKVVGLRNLSDKEILNIIDRAFEHRSSVRRQLEQTIPRVRLMVLDLFEDLECPEGGARESILSEKTREV